MEELETVGYVQYEISNYAKPGRECLHNLGYWRADEYAGLGPSATSTRAGWRRQNLPDTAAYTSRVLEGSDRFASLEKLDSDTLRAERISLGLRTLDGIAVDEVAEDQRRALADHGLIESIGNRMRLTRKGRLVADEIAVEVV